MHFVIGNTLPHLSLGTVMSLGTRDLLCSRKLHGCLCGKLSVGRKLQNIL